MFSGSTEVNQALDQFTADVAMKAAREEAGLDDFGDDEFVEPLQMLVKCAMEDIPFKDAGAFNFMATLQRFLVNRLRFANDLKAHPEILEEDVSDPIMILGMPRTGTTKLQRLMSADPKAQNLALWRLLNPAPFPDEAQGAPEGRLAFARIVEEATRANATFTTSHETAAEEADEDSFLALQAIDYWMLFHIFPSPSFLEWVRERDQVEAHTYEKKLLQYLQWQDGGRRGRRWVLKNPGAIGHIQTLAEVFPEITFVHSHRNLAEVLPSFCRLMEGILEPLVELGDMHAFGRTQIEAWRPEFSRHHAQRAALGDKLRIVDVSYLEVVRNSIDVAKEAYAAAGIVWSGDAETAMLGWEAQNQQHKHGKAAYSLERYGLSEEMIADAFGGLDDLPPKAS